MKFSFDLDDELCERLRRLIPLSELNRFVNDAIADKVRALERVHDEMREGYTITQANRDVIAREWETIDLEGWPQY